MPDSLPALLAQRAQEMPHLTALRYHNGSLWQSVCYRDYYHFSQSVAGALIRRGVRPGDRIGLLSENCWEWLPIDLGIQAAGAITVPLHVASPTAEIRALLKQVDARHVIASPTQAMKLAESLDFGIFHEPAEAESLHRLTALGRDDVATILFTSGTTGEPQGVMLTHGNLLSNAESAQAVLPWGTDSVMLNFLPFSHIYARTADGYQALVAGATLALASSPDAVPAQLGEVHPHFVRGVPRFYEKMVALAGSSSSALARAFGERIRWLFVGGAGLPLQIAERYCDAGLTLLQGYGLTETSPTITVNRPDRFRLGTVGVPLPGYEVRIADDGEILSRGPHIMRGYWNNPSATTDAIRDGWFATGDLGYIDDEGFLTIIGRKKEMIVLSTGRKIVPFRVESRLQAEPAIEYAVLVGEGRPYLTVLIQPRAGIPSPDWQSCIAHATADLAEWERPVRWMMLSSPFRIDQGELTVSLKVRREVVLANYRAAIDTMYD